MAKTNTHIQKNSASVYRKVYFYLQKLYSEYDYLGVPFEEICSNQIIEKLANGLNAEEIENLDFTACEDKVNNFYLELVLKTLKSENNIKIIEKYINKNIKSVANTNLAIYELSKLEAFFKKVGFAAPLNVYLELINNNKIVLNNLRVIVDNNIDKIRDGSFTKFITEDEVIFLIETYCEVNNIEINDDLLFDEDNEMDDFIPDSDKMFWYSLRKKKLLTIEEERVLLQRFCLHGDMKARDELVERNMRLVAKIASRFRGKGLEFLDLIQEGSIGLMRAIDNYDIDKGLKLSTYATWWIRQSIDRAVKDKKGTIRIPVHLSEKLTEYYRVSSSLFQKLGREPSIEEVSSYMGISVHKLKDLLENIPMVSSLNAFVNEDDKKAEVGDLIVDNETRFEDDVIEKDFLERLKLLFAKLKFSKRTCDILIKRFGLDGEEPETLEAVAKRYEITRERVRQLELKALRALRNSAYSRSFFGYEELPIANENNKARRSRSRGTTNSDAKKKKKERLEMARKVMNLEELFCKEIHYTEAQLYEAIGRLSPSDQALMAKRYVLGEKITQSEERRCRQTIIPKVKKLLIDPTLDFANDVKRVRKPKTDKTSFTQVAKEEPFLGNTKESKDDNSNKTLEIDNKEKMVNESVVNESIEEKEDSISTVVIKEEKIVEDTIEIESVETKNENIDSSLTPVEKENNLSKEDCINILTLLKTPTFAQMMEHLSPKDAVIISLKLGYVDDKYFSTESIANFLGITCEEVNESTKNALLLYKDTFVNFIDNAIEVATAPVKKKNVNK